MLFVMPGLDPGIHRPSQESFLRRRWIAGSSPAMTRKPRSCFGLALPVFLRAFCGPDSALDKIYFN
jgi:hypothetical protein